MRTPRGPRSVRRIAVAAVAPLVILVLLLTATPSIAAPQHPGGPPQPTWHTAFLTSVARPDLVPGGVNDPSCRPDGRHPAPVVLVNGTLENSYANWSKLAPQLVDDGFCVWSFNYGAPPAAPSNSWGRCGPPARSSRRSSTGCAG